MREVPVDYVPPSTDLPQFGDGTYTAHGFHWFTVDDQQKPMLVSQAGSLVGRLRFTLTDGRDGPPMSLRLGEMALLVVAFGGEVDQLPPLPEESQAGAVSSYMEKIAVVCNALGGEVKVEVKGNWVNRLLAAEIKGDLCFRLIDLFPKENGVPTPKKGNYAYPWYGMQFEVLAGKSGASTPFKGATFTEIESYAVYVTDKGMPDWTRTPTGEITAAAAKLARIMKMTAPALFQEGHVHPDPANLLPEWFAAALAENAALSGYRVRPDKGDRAEVQWPTVERIYLDQAQTATAATKKAMGPVRSGVDIAAENQKARGLLVELLTLLSDGQPAFEDVSEMKLSATGKAAAKTYLTPLREAGILSPTTLKSMAFDEVKAVLDNIDKHAAIPSEKSEPLTQLRHKLAATGVGVDEESSDF